MTERSDWLDYGKDYYAAVSYNNLPPSRRIMIGWMNNWQYAQSIPTAPWRSAMSVPREITLRTIDGRPQLFQHPIRRLAKLRLNPGYYLARRTIAEGTQTLADARATGKGEVTTTMMLGAADVISWTVNEVRRAAA